VPVTNCAGTVAPSVTIKNFGGNVLSFLEINYQVNNEPLNIYNWVGSLLYDETEVVSLPAVTCNVSDENNLTVYTTNPNGNTDEDPTNDTISMAFNSASEVIPDVYLFLKLDNNPEETSWELKNSTGEVLSSGGNYQQPLSFIKDTFALSQNDCYTFVIYDEGGDGLINGGYFSLRQNNFNLIYENYEFTDSEESVQFSVSISGISEKPDAHPFNVFINPFSRNIQVSFNLENTASIEIRMYNLLGEEIFQKPEQILKKGKHVQNIDICQFIPVVYLISLKINHEVFTRKVALHL
jgi:predicted secreted protein